MELGLALADHIREAWGGVYIYIPKGCRLTASWRDQAIYAGYNGGSSVQELARQYKLSARHIYGILARMRDIERRRAEQPKP